MKIKYTLLTTFISLSTLGVSFAETSAEALEKGVQLQETEGEFQSASIAFQKVIANGKDTTDAVAEAHYRLAQCYFSLSEDKKAKRQLEVLKKTFGPENAWVKKAAKLNTQVVKFFPAPFKKEGEFHYYHIKSLDGKSVGDFMSAIMANSYKGKEVWQSFFGRGMGHRSFSTCIFDAKSFRPMDAQNYFMGLGNVIINFHADGSSTGSNLSTNQPIGDVKVPDGMDCVYDNDQVVHLIRAVDLKLGEKIIIPTRNPIIGVVTPIELHAVELVDITVPLGKFECLKIESSIQQTFYISTDENRYLVKLDMPGGSMNLAEVEDWIASEATTLKADKMPLAFTLPASAMWYGASDEKHRYKLNFHLGDFSILEGSLEVRVKDSSDKETPTNSRELENQILAKYKEKHADFSIDEKTREQIQVGDDIAEVAISHYTRGQLKASNYHAHIVGKNHMARVRCHFQEGEEKQARSKLLEILKSINFN